SLTLGSSGVHATSGRGRIVGTKTEGSTRVHIGHALTISATHLAHGRAHQLVNTLLTEVVLLTTTIHDLVDTHTGGIILTTFTFHLFVCSSLWIGCGISHPHLANSSEDC